MSNLNGTAFVHVQRWLIKVVFSIRRRLHVFRARRLHKLFRFAVQQGPVWHLHLLELIAGHLQLEGVVLVRHKPLRVAAMVEFVRSLVIAKMHRITPTFAKIERGIIKPVFVHFKTIKRRRRRRQWQVIVRRRKMMIAVRILFVLLVRGTMLMMRLRLPCLVRHDGGEVSFVIEARRLFLVEDLFHALQHWIDSAHIGSAVGGRRRRRRHILLAVQRRKRLEHMLLLALGVLETKVKAVHEITVHLVHELQHHNLFVLLHAVVQVVHTAVVQQSIATVALHHRAQRYLARVQLWRV
mmetsp:Transcript_2359/g.4577  ORF Transcript_2359/g.4577 Transcript_2359/m.4577 type:complete len:296 (+) Transcript_2359:2875-3762(+)